MNKEYKRLIIFLVIFLVFVACFVLYLAWPLLTGDTIILATTPVDPLDFFRGQYLIIRYDIGTIPAILGVSPGDGVYVALKKDDNGISRYAARSLSNKFKLDFNPKVIRGTVKSVYGESMTVEYGIEQYFFERNAEINSRGMLVEARVSVSGGARIVKLLDREGNDLEIEYA